MKHLKEFNLFEHYNYIIKPGEMYCNAKQLTSLPELPNDLILLDCSHNKLKKLPKLPDSLKILRCGENELETLPELPEGLRYINCHSNQLINLPNVHYGLTDLLCYNNNLTSLPELPDSLKSLWCYNNPLECLLPFKYTEIQKLSWLQNYYYPYIRSYVGQKNILTKYPYQARELEKQANIHPVINKEFSHLFTGAYLNLL
jgi:hypothetical protein